MTCVEGGVFVVLEGGRKEGGLGRKGGGAPLKDALPRSLMRIAQRCSLHTLCQVGFQLTSKKDLQQLTDIASGQYRTSLGIISTPRL